MFEQTHIPTYFFLLPERETKKRKTCMICLSHPQLHLPGCTKCTHIKGVKRANCLSRVVISPLGAAKASYAIELISEQVEEEISSANKRLDIMNETHLGDGKLTSEGGTSCIVCLWQPRKVGTQLSNIKQWTKIEREKFRKCVLPLFLGKTKTKTKQKVANK